MPAWSARVITSTRHEWEVPAAQPWGAALDDIESALGVAARRYRELHGISDLVTLPGDALRFHVTDDAIVISFTHERPAA